MKQKEIIAEAVRKSRQKKSIDMAEVLKKPYLNEEEVSALTGQAVQTLRNARHMRSGIPYLIVSKRSIRYRTADVLNFMEARPVTFDEVA